MMAPSGKTLRTTLTILYMSAACAAKTLLHHTSANVNAILSISPGASNTTFDLSWSGFTDTQSGVAKYGLVFSTSGIPHAAPRLFTRARKRALAMRTLKWARPIITASAPLTTPATSPPERRRAKKVLPEYTPPTGSVVINNGDPYTKSAKVTLAISADDNGGSGLSQMCISNTATCKAWIPYATGKAWTLDNW